MDDVTSNRHKTKDFIAGTFTVDIEKLVYGGYGLARTEYGVILVPRTVPGDSVRVASVRKKKGVLHGNVDDVLTPSKHRVFPFCDNAMKGCGGCQWQHIDYNEQTRIKKEIIEESMERIAKTKRVVPPLISDPQYKETRIRSVFHMGTNEQNMHEMGYYKLNTNEIVPIYECPLCVSPINRTLAVLQDNLLFLEQANTVSVISNGKDVHVHIEGRGFARKECIQELHALFNGQGRDSTGISWSGEKGGCQSVGSACIELNVDGWRYMAGGETFFQGHSTLNGTLIEIIRNVIGKREGGLLLDLFCGVGFLSIPFSSQFNKVVGIDNHEGSIRLARENTKLNNADNVLFYRQNLGSNKCRFDLSSVDTVILDPPRRGCAETLLKNLMGLNPFHIIMVSCNPATMARDLKSLMENGYEMVSCHGLDLFPQTFHIETVAHLEKVK